MFFPRIPSLDGRCAPTVTGKVNVKMNFVDDAGNASVYDGTVNVQYEGEPVRLDR